MIRTVLVSLIFLIAAEFQAVASESISLSALPYEAQQIATEVANSCREFGHKAKKDSDHVAVSFRLKGGDRIIFFDAKDICDVVFKGNGVCSTGGCDIFAYREKYNGFFTQESRVSVLNYSIETNESEGKFSIIATIRGDMKPCDKQKPEVCIFEIKSTTDGSRWTKIR